MTKGQEGLVVAGLGLGLAWGVSRLERWSSRPKLPIALTALTTCSVGAGCLAAGRRAYRSTDICVWGFDAFAVASATLAFWLTTKGIGQVQQGSWVAVHRGSLQIAAGLIGAAPLAASQLQSANTLRKGDWGPVYEPFVPLLLKLREDQVEIAIVHIGEEQLEDLLLGPLATNTEWIGGKPQLTREWWERSVAVRQVEQRGPLVELFKPDLDDLEMQSLAIEFWNKELGDEWHQKLDEAFAPKWPDRLRFLRRVVFVVGIVTGVGLHVWKG